MTEEELIEYGKALLIAVECDMEISVNRVDEYTEVTYGFFVKDLKTVKVYHEDNMYEATYRAILEAVRLYEQQLGEHSGRNNLEL